jgi:muconolactone delta-isomerase
VIFLVDLTVDYTRASEKGQELIQAEWREEEAMLERRQLVGIWRKASAKGVFMMVDVPSHDALAAQIRAMPLYPYFTDVTATPLMQHPNFPQFVKPATVHEKP